jgi:hypothetical protein
VDTSLFRNDSLPCSDSLVDALVWQDYIPLSFDYSDLLEKLEWAKANDGQVREGRACSNFALSLPTWCHQSRKLRCVDACTRVACFKFRCCIPLLATPARGSLHAKNEALFVVAREIGTQME